MEKNNTVSLTIPALDAGFPVDHQITKVAFNEAQQGVEVTIKADAPFKSGRLIRTIDGIPHSDVVAATIPGGTGTVVVHDRFEDAPFMRTQSYSYRAELSTGTAPDAA